MNRNLLSIDPATSPYCRMAWVVADESYADTDTITTLTDRATRGLGLTLTVTGGVTKQTVNGIACARTNGTTGYLTAGAVGDFPFLHDGHGVMVLALVRLQESNAHYNPIVDTCGAGASGNIGMTFALDNRTGSAINQRISLTVANGNVTFANLAMTADERYTAELWHLVQARVSWQANLHPRAEAGAFADGRTVVDGIRAGGASIGNFASRSEANPSFKLYVGAAAAASPTLFSLMDLAGLWIFDADPPDDHALACIRHICGRFSVGWAREPFESLNYVAFPGIAQRQDKTLIAVASHFKEHSGEAYGSSFASASGDGGWSWSQTKSLVTRGSSTTWTSATHPFVTSSGTILVAGFSNAPAGGAAQTIVRRSTDGGQTYSAATITDLFAANTRAQAGKMIQIGSSILLPVYGKVNGGDTYTSVGVLFSTDDGATFGSGVTIDNGQTDSLNYTEASLVSLGGNDVLAFYRDDTTSPNRIMKASSANAGASWGAGAATITSHSGRPSAIRLASGTILIGVRSTTAPNRLHIYWSSDDAATWNTGPILGDAINGFNAYTDFVEDRAGYPLMITASEVSTQATSTNPAAVLCRVRRLREADLLLVA